MESNAAFEAFYRSTRAPLLGEVLLATGDLTAATAAVREAYVMAGHHWGSLQHRPDPMTYVRPLAWRLARRKHSGRIWHRNRGLPDQTLAVLEALSHLNGRERRVLVLVEAAGLPLEVAADAADLGPRRAAAVLMRARGGAAEALDVPATAIAERLTAAIATVPADELLPRPARVQRQGERRRQRFLVAAAVGVVAVALGVGAAVRDPALERGFSARVAPPDPTASPTAPPPEEEDTVADDLLGPAQVRPLAPGRSWVAERTVTNTRGDGLNYVCQGERFADPRGRAALVRFFTAVGVRESVVQSLEISQSPRAASRAFETVVGWFAECQEARLQLLQTYRVEGVGDQATVMVLRDWGRPVTTYALALTRVGATTTALVTRSVSGAGPRVRQVVDVLATAARQICSDEAGACVDTPRWRAVAPPPSDEAPGLLAVVDLPPVGRIDQPWVGIDATSARTSNPAATICDDADFGVDGVTRSRTRTYLIPQARVPARFGLSETVAAFAGPGRAAAFVRRLRDRIAGCEDRDPTTSVSVVSAGARRDGLDVSTYRLTTEVGEGRSVQLRTGLVRSGARVAQVTFVPSDSDGLTDEQFDALLVRAGERLGQLG